MIIPRISEALDAELLRQGIDLGSIDAELLAAAAWEACADVIQSWGYVAPARHIRHELVRTTTAPQSRSQIGEKA